MSMGPFLAMVKKFPLYVGLGGRVMLLKGYVRIPPPAGYFIDKWVVPK